MKDYSLAAVGLGAIAFSPAANASVAAVPLNHTVGINTTYTVTIGANNVMVVSNSSSSTSTFAVAVSQGLFWGPAPLPRGVFVPITGGQTIPGAFLNNGTGGALVFSTEVQNDQSFLGSKYLGFSFGTGVNIHYGWVQFNISRSGAHQPYTVTVVEAAYEQCAGQPIIAGATTGGANCSVPPTPAPNSLWLMALGASGIAGFELLRRRRTA